MLWRGLAIAAAVTLPGASASAVADENEEPICSRDVNDQYLADADIDTGGMLYKIGSNLPPRGHRDFGLLRAAEVAPRDADGNVDLDNGLIGLAAIGMSNAHRTFGTYQRRMHDAPRRHALVAVDLAEGGETLGNWVDPIEHRVRYDNIWRDDPDDLGIVYGRLEAMGISPNQLQVVWIFNVLERWPGDLDGGVEGFNLDQAEFVAKLRTLIDVEVLPRFPQVRMIYLSSRELGFYAPLGDDQGEPRAYQTGFMIREVVDQYVTEAKAPGYAGPYVAWGPYWWDHLQQDPANPEPRDCAELAYDTEFYLECEDFVDCGGNGNVHPSVLGQAKLGQMLNDFFATDEVSATWYNSQADDYGPSGHIIVNVLDDRLWNDDTQTTSTGDAVIVFDNPDDSVFLKFDLTEVRCGALPCTAAQISRAELSLRASRDRTLGDIADGSVSAVETEAWSPGMDLGPLFHPADVGPEVVLTSCRQYGGCGFDFTDGVQAAIGQHFYVRLHTNDPDVNGGIRSMEWTEDGETDPPRLIIIWRDPSLGDLDGDGDVGASDLIILLGAWGPCDECSDCLADLDADCTVGTSDLIILLGNWG